MAVVPKGWAEMKRGVLSVASGTVSNIIVSKNGVVRISDDKNRKKSRQKT